MSAQVQNGTLSQTSLKALSPNVTIRPNKNRPLRFFLRINARVASHDLYRSDRGLAEILNVWKTARFVVSLPGGSVASSAREDPPPVQESFVLVTFIPALPGDLSSGYFFSVRPSHHQGLQTALEDSDGSPEELARLTGLWGGVYTFCGTF